MSVESSETKFRVLPKGKDLLMSLQMNGRSTRSPPRFAEAKKTMDYGGRSHYHSQGGGHSRKIFNIESLLLLLCLAASLLILPLILPPLPPPPLMLLLLPLGILAVLMILVFMPTSSNARDVTTTYTYM